MAKPPKATLQIDRRRPHSKGKIGRNRVRGGFRERRADGTADRRYLEVVEEMLRQRENNGRDRDELMEL